jgi:hypothetical protein
VIEKRVTAILYGCDRELWRRGPLQVRVADLFAQGRSQIVWEGRTREPIVELRLQLPFDGGQVYGLTFSAPRHRPGWQLLRRVDFIRSAEQAERDDIILRLMLVPDKPGVSDVSNGFRRLEQAASPFAATGSGVDAATFASLDVAAQMVFLNVDAKLRETVIDGAPLMSFVRGVRHVAVDRVFLLFDASLKPRMPRAVDFAGAAGHGQPGAFPDLPAHPDSWKHTRFAEGNVQLSFSKDAAPMPGGGAAAPLVHSADVDIDLGRGLAHAREWLENNVFKPGHKTNQALVYALLYAQGLLPHYVLEQAEVPVARGLRRGAPKRAPARTKAAPTHGTRPKRTSRTARRVKHR